jgi:hypothetical protein
VKLLFTGAAGRCPAPAKNLLQKVLGSSKTLKKHYPINTFLKVLGILKGLAIFAEGKFAPSVSEEIFKSPLSGSRAEPWPINCNFLPHLCKKRTPLFTPRKKISNLTKLEKFAFPT